jgi:hypothetical protein
MRGPARIGWVLLASLSVLVSCSDPFDSGEEKELEQARARWANAGLLDYQVEVRLSCFCQAALPVFSRLEVRAGQVVAAAPLAPTPADDIPLDAWPTVPELFESIESASRQSVYTEIEAQYDSTLGYPTRLELRCKADVLDCGATYELQALTPIIAGP